MRAEMAAQKDPFDPYDLRFRERVLESAHTLGEVERAARDLGIGDAILNAPLSVITTFDTTARGFLAAAIETRVTIAEYLSRPESSAFAQVPSNVRSAIIRAIRGHLLSTFRAANPNPQAISIADAARNERAALAAFVKSESDGIADWARRYDVTDRLLEPLEILGERLPQNLRYALGYQPLVRVIESAGKQRLTRDQIETVATAIRDWLKEQGESLRAGTREEAELLAAPLPSDPALRTIAETLLPRRSEVRRCVKPRSRAVPAAGARSSYTGDPAALIWVENGDRGQARAVVALDTGEVRCTCLEGYPHFGRRADAEYCAHELSAIDEALRLLGDPLEGAKLAKELSRPKWSRLFEELERLAPRSAPEMARGETIIEWNIEVHESWATIEPLVRPPLKKSEGHSRGAVKSWEHLLSKEMPELAEADRKVLEAVLRTGGRGTPLGHPAAMRAALVALVGHPRVTSHARTLNVEVVLAPVGISVSERAVEVTVGGERVDAGKLLEQIDGGSRGRMLREAVARFEPKKRRILVTPVDAKTARMIAVVERYGGELPPEALPELQARVGAIERLAPVSLAPSLRGREVEVDRRVVVVLAGNEDGSLDVALRVRPVVGGPLLRAGEGEETVAGTDGRERLFARRDRAEELARMKTLAESVQLPLLAGYPPFEVELDRAWRREEKTAAPPVQSLELLATLREAQGVVVEWERGEQRVRRVKSKSLKVRLESKHDWFGVNGTATIDGHTVEIAELLAAVRLGQCFVRVRDGVWAEIEEALLAKLRAVADSTFEERGETLARRGAIWALEDLASDVERFDVPAAWQALTRKMHESERAVAPLVALPDGVSLREYQVEGFRWMSRLSSWGAGGILADDMGLGKTAQALALLSRRANEGPAIVLAPTSVCANWRAEAARFAPSLRVTLYRESREIASLGKRDVVVVSYGLLTRDAEKLGAKTFATLIVDEAQQVKNAATHRARAARELKAEARFALSGTPLENHLGELWSIFRIVFPELLGSHDSFRDRFSAPIERDQDPSGERRAALARLVRPFLLRRNKSEVARELPSRTQIDVEVEMSAGERAVYEAERIASLEKFEGDTSGGNRAGRAGRARIEILAALTRLRLLACHPRLGDDASEIPSAKLERFLELLDEVLGAGHRALVFSQFTSHLALVRAELRARGIAHHYLDGKTRPAERDRLVRAFQDGECGVFLLSLKAGGAGINLTGADYVFHLDPWWNPAVEDQATDRAHRIGQTRPVTVLRLIAKGTIEEAILAMHAGKRKLVESVLAGADAATRLSNEDILDLLRRGFS